ncbi:liver carboxylesterase 4-like [Argonauta hians]
MAPNLITRDQNVDDVSSENSAPEETKKIPRPCNQLPTIVIVSHDTAYDQLLPRQSLYLDYPYHCTQQHYWRSKKATFLFSIVILVLLALFCITIIATTNIVKQVKEANRNNKNKNLSLVVQTSCGPLNGENHGNHIVFRAIPFAVPPTGEHRWSHPVPNLQSAGRCHLKGQGTGPANPIVCPQRSAQTGQMIGQENCLYLSIRLPRQAFKGATNLPVVVVMQGEGQHFEADEGFGGKHFESIRPLVSQGASVIVSVNYRLGVFGFLSLDSTTDNTTLTGNYGLMDQILALQWIKENIEHFNGDSKSVIVYGESSGSEALAGLLRSPKSQNLFHGMIAVDPEWMAIRPVDDAITMMKDLNFYNETLKTACGEKDIIECLKQMESKKIVESLSEIRSNSVNEAPLQTQLKQYLRPLNHDFSLTIDEITLFPGHDAAAGNEMSSPKPPNIPVFIGQVCHHFCGTWKDRPHSLAKRIGQLFKIETEIAAAAAVKLYTHVEEARRTEADMVSEMSQDIRMCQTENLLRAANYPLYYLVSPLRKSSPADQCRSNSSKRLQQMHNSPFLCSRNLHKELTQGTSTGKSLPTGNGITDANAKADTDPDLTSLWNEIFSTVAVVAHRRDSAALFQPKHSNHIISVAPVGPAGGVCHFWDKHRSF